MQVRLTTNNKRSWPSWVESTTHVAHSLMSLNSSVNFYVYCVKHFRVSCCPAKSSSSNNGMGQVLISTTASGDHNMVNRVNGTTRNLSGVSSRNLNSETGINETIVWITTINNNELFRYGFRDFDFHMGMTEAILNMKTSVLKITKS